jgi:hypothetical protein
MWLGRDHLIGSDLVQWPVTAGACVMTELPGCFINLLTFQSSPNIQPGLGLSFPQLAPHLDAVFV